MKVVLTRYFYNKCECGDDVKLLEVRQKEKGKDWLSFYAFCKCGTLFLTPEFITPDNKAPLTKAIEYMIG